MVEYVEGTVCGVDNCPSNLWRRVNGRNVCQYGHVNEYDVEINDDDDNYQEGARVRKINKVAGLTRNAIMDDKMQAYMDTKVSRQTMPMNEVKKYKKKAIQITLAKQVKFVMKRFNITGTCRTAFLKVIKWFWTEELLKPKLNFLVVSLKVYLALLKIGIPIYLCDFLSMIQEKRYPFIRPELFLPEKINNIVIGQIRGLVNLDSIKLMNDSYNTKTEVSRKVIDDDVTLNYFPLLVRTIIHLRLPMEIVILVHQVIQRQKIKLNFNSQEEYNHPETALCALIVGCGKLFFTCNPEMYPKWITLYWESQNAAISFDPEIQKLKLRQDIMYDTELSDLMEWDNDKIDLFIKYYMDNVLDIHKFEKPADRKTLTMNRLQAIKTMESIFNVEYEKSNLKHKTDEYMKHLETIYDELYSSKASDNYKLDIIENSPIFINVMGKTITSMYFCSNESMRTDFAWANTKICKIIE